MNSIKVQKLLGIWMLYAGIWAAYGCTGLRKIPEGDALYTGMQLKFLTDTTIVKRFQLSNALEDVAEPTPNTKLLFMRPFLAIYNSVGEPSKDRGIKYFLKYKLGEEPVYLSDIAIQNTARLMENRMYHNGYFNARTDFKIHRKRKTASIDYEIEPGAPYRIDTIGFQFDDDALGREIMLEQQHTQRLQGTIYTLDNLKKERERIAGNLRDKGYYYLTASSFLFQADTSNQNHTVRLLFQLKKEVSSIVKQSYSIRNISVHSDFIFENYQPSDTLLIDGYMYLVRREIFKPQSILTNIYFGQGQRYSRSAHSRSLNYLMGMGVFRFANIEFNPVEGSENPELDAIVYLSTLPRMSLRAEASTISKSNNFAGPGLKLSFQNRNLFGGAENLTINLTNRFEWQIGSGGTNTNYELGVDANLRLAGLRPFNFRQGRVGEFMPSTLTSIGFNTARRVGLFQLNSFNLSYGYNWKSTLYNNHIFRLIDISYVKLAKTSAEFEEFLQENPIVRRSFSEQFILGTNYSFIYNTLYDKEKRGGLYLKTDVDVAGNLANGLYHLLDGRELGENESNQILGLPFAQYAKTQVDVRYFFKLDRKNTLATRFVAGVGVPYGNASTMPFLKQFFVGGPNSIRAFQARTVGPGSYFNTRRVNRRGFLLVDQSGDIKLEASTEYRFDIISYLKGAVFLDAGNIWLIDEDPQRPGSGFKWDNFASQLAVGTGFGFRIDIDFIVLRFDTAFPLRIPGRESGSPWVINEISPWNRSWRRENMILNIAVGYPF
ncbi:MAG: BamA/TamA family outer membrane protein [Cyclobacteriaceae bacterium]|nr:BamA/TamA family outer membrane protein [Cyclobacteriaceae bacterium]